MDQCDRCGGSVAPGGEWIEVNHHHAHMTFGSTFCCGACAAAYLEDGLEDGIEDRVGSETDGYEA
jgi:hypothetical protein